MTRKWRHEPGTTFVYDTGVSQIISAVLEEATGMSVLDYASAKLFEPLGIAEARWDTNGDGVHGAGEGLFLTPREMVKFGQLILNEGMWEGERLVSAEYITTSTSNQLSADIADGEYGYLWWLGDVDGNPAHLAVGYGGQMIVIVPNLDLVVAITSDFWRHHEGNEAVIHEVIAPAIVD